MVFSPYSALAMFDYLYRKIVLWYLIATQGVWICTHCHNERLRYSILCFVCTTRLVIHHQGNWQSQLCISPSFISSCSHSCKFLHTNYSLLSFHLRPVYTGGCSLSHTLSEVFSFCCLHQQPVVIFICCSLGTGARNISPDCAEPQP